MRLSQLACSELMDTSQSMLLLVRIRGYVSTSSYPALCTHARAYVDITAAEQREVGEYLSASRRSSRAMRLRCICNAGVWVALAGGNGQVGTT